MMGQSANGPHDRAQSHSRLCHAMSETPHPSWRQTRRSPGDRRENPGSVCDASLGFAHRRTNSQSLLAHRGHRGKPAHKTYVGLTSIPFGGLHGWASRPQRVEPRIGELRRPVYRGPGALLYALGPDGRQNPHRAPRPSPEHHANNAREKRAIRPCLTKSVFSTSVPYEERVQHVRNRHRNCSPPEVLLPHLRGTPPTLHRQVTTQAIVQRSTGEQTRGCIASEFG